MPRRGVKSKLAKANGAAPNRRNPISGQPQSAKMANLNRTEMSLRGKALGTSAHLVGTLGSNLPAYSRSGSRSTRALTVPGVMEYTYNMLGSTDEGREYALINLHPCGEYVAACQGIPDETQTAVATPAFRGDSTIGFNASIFDSPPSPSAPFDYDLQMVVPPHAEVDYIYRLRYPSGPSGTWSRWKAQRTSYFAENNDGSAVTLGSSGYTSHRLIGRGMTVHFDAPSLSDQGRLVAGQIKPGYRREAHQIGSFTGNPADGGAAVEHRYYFPVSETELTAQDPLPAQWQCKDGLYIPHRYVNPKQFFSDIASPNIVTGSTTIDNSIPVPATILTISPDPSLPFGMNNLDKFSNSGSWDGNLLDFSDNVHATWGISEPVNQYTSVSFWLGISNTSKLHVKTRLFVEAEVVARNSPVTPYTHKSPTLDRRALDTVAIIAQNQEHVFFACDNDLSGILQSIGSILPGILEPLGAALEDTGLPILGQIGSVGRKIGKGLSSFLAA